MAPPPPPPPPYEVMELIFLRLPPDDPASLLSAALVCKRWASVISGASFRARFRGFHGGPPMLSFICNPRGGEDGAMACFMPTSTFRTGPAELRGWRAADARHGCVLLCPLRDTLALFNLTVWVPAMGELPRLPAPPRPRPRSWSAALICGCDGHHPGCHDEPFRVILVGTTDEDGIFSCVYSSEGAAWSEAASTEHPESPACLESVAGVLVGNALHFLLQGSANILRYDLISRDVSLIRRPPTCVYYHSRPLLMIMEDGMLGFASLNHSALSLWPREVGAEGKAIWGPSRVIELETLLYDDDQMSIPFYLLGYADEIGVLFLLNAVGGLFLINLRSGHVDTVETDREIYGIVPFVSYCIPGGTTVHRRRRRGWAPADVPPEVHIDDLTEELLEEILLRLPVDNPHILVHAATVCRQWCCLIANEGFHKRFARNYNSPPMVGVIANMRCGRHFFARFVPTIGPTLLPPAELINSRALDSRHGRVLLATTSWQPHLQLWDPVTGSVRDLPPLPEDIEFGDNYAWNAAVICAAHGVCNHVSCHQGPFRVVFVDTEKDRLRALIYGSDQDAWGDPVYGPPSPLWGMEPSPSALVRDTLYFLADETRRVVSFCLRTKTFTTYLSPKEHNVHPGVLTTTPDGELHLVSLINGSIINWNLLMGPNGDLDDGWEQTSSLDLNEMFLDGDLLQLSDSYLSFGHGAGMYFLLRLDGRSIAMLYPDYSIMTKDFGEGLVFGVTAYAKFFIPALGSDSITKMIKCIDQEISTGIKR